MLEKVAHFLSFVFSPLLVPTYGVVIALNTTVLSVLSAGVKWGVPSVTLLITCVMPMLAIGIMWKLGKVKDFGLNNRTERTVPYLVVTTCYLLCGIYLYKVHAPIWLVMFMCGAVLAAIVSQIVNRWWKISAHMTAMGGLLAITMNIALSDFAVCDMMWVVCGVILCCGLVGTARVGLQRHTFGQVAAGTINGFVCVTLLSYLIK